MSFWSDIINNLGTIEESAIGGEANVYTSGGTANPGAGVTSGVAGPLVAMVGVFEAAWTMLTDGKMWRSLGWLLLGIVLMLLGVALWIGPSAERASPIGIAASQLG